MRNVLLATTAVFCASAVTTSAAPMAFDFSQSGYTNNGTLTGTFVAEDLNGNGQISSFDGEVSELSAQFSSDTIEVPLEFEFFGFPEGPPMISVFSDDIEDDIILDGPIFEDDESQFQGLVFDLDGLGIIGDGLSGDVEGLALAGFSQSINTGPGPFERCDGTAICGELTENFVTFDESSEVVEPIFTSEVIATTTQAVIVTGADLGDAGSFETNPLLEGEFEGNSFLFDVDWELIPPGELFFIDPEIAVGYTYAVEGTAFSAVQAPTLVSVPDADGEYLLTYTGASGVMTEVLTAGELFNFDAADSVMSFTITGIDTGLALDPTDIEAFVTGVAVFDPGSASNLSQTPITTDLAAVPLPASSLLLLAGVGGLVSMRRRAKG